MVTRRTVIKHGGYAALAVAGAPLFVRDARGQSTTTTFDYYISPTGDDNNAGTLASPWSITALNNKRITYSGKRVGLLPGTYQYGTVGGVQTTIYSNCQNSGLGGFNNAAISVEGGTPSSPTYIGSSDSTGSYSPRTATIDASNPVGGATPTNSCACIGQGMTGISHAGNVVFDGIRVTNSFSLGMMFYPPGFSGSPGGATGTVVKNCEIFHILTGNENGNMAGIYAYWQTGWLLQNNKIHDVVPSTGIVAGWDCAGIFSQECLNNVYEYNTVYNCNVSIYDKNTTQGSIYRYNYLENLGTYQTANFEDCAGGAAGSTVTMHNNIVVGPTGVWGANAFHLLSLQNWVVYNNTFWYAAGGFAGQGSAGVFLPCASVTFYNNIVACGGNTTGNGAVCWCSGTVTLSDYNALQSGGNLFGVSPTSSPYAFKSYTLSGWQSLSGFDTHSTQVATGTLFGSWQSLTPTRFQTIPTALQTLGRVGGVSSGAATALGAWGNAATQIGCNFGPVPNAPVLSVG